MTQLILSGTSMDCYKSSSFGEDSSLTLLLPARRRQRHRDFPGSPRGRPPRPSHRPVHRLLHDVFGSSHRRRRLDGEAQRPGRRQGAHVRPLSQASLLSLALSLTLLTHASNSFASCWFIAGFASSWGPLGTSKYFSSVLRASSEAREGAGPSPSRALLGLSSLRGAALTVNVIVRRLGRRRRAVPAQDRPALRLARDGVQLAQQCVQLSFTLSSPSLADALCRLHHRHDRSLHHRRRVRQPPEQDHCASPPFDFLTPALARTDTCASPRLQFIWAGAIARTSIQPAPSSLRRGPCEPDRLARTSSCSTDSLASPDSPCARSVHDLRVLLPPRDRGPLARSGRRALPHVRPSSWPSRAGFLDVAAVPDALLPLLLAHSGVPAWRSSSWTPYGGATKRNREDRTDEAKRLKLGTEESRLENVPAKRNLDDEEETMAKAA